MKAPLPLALAFLLFAAAQGRAQSDQPQEPPKKTLRRPKLKPRASGAPVQSWFQREGPPAPAGAGNAPTVAVPAKTAGPTKPVAVSTAAVAAPKTQPKAPEAEAPPKEEGPGEVFVTIRGCPAFDGAQVCCQKGGWRDPKSQNCYASEEACAKASGGHCQAHAAEGPVKLDCKPGLVPLRFSDEMGYCCSPQRWTTPANKGCYPSRKECEAKGEGPCRRIGGD